MGNEQRKYGRELHTNEFDVVPECQRDFCKRLILERLNVQLGVRVFVVIFGARLARFSQSDVCVPTRCHEAGIILQEVDRPSWSRPSKGVPCVSLDSPW